MYRGNVKRMSYTGIEINKEVNEHNSNHTAGHLKRLF